MWGRLPAFLTPTVHSPGCPTSPALGCGWLPDGAECGTSGLLVLHVFGKYSTPFLPSPCFSLKGVLCCSSAFRFGTRSFNAVDWRLSVVSQEFWKSDCTQSFPRGFWHSEWQGCQCSLSFCLSSLVGGKSHPAIPGFGHFSTLQFIFPFHLLRKCMSHFRRSRSHPLQAVLKANSLLPFSLFLLLCPGVLSKNKELQMEHSSLCAMSSPSLPTTGSFIVIVLLLQQFSVFWNQIEASEKERILYVQEVDLVTWRARKQLSANIFLETSSDKFILSLGSQLSCDHDKQCETSDSRRVTDPCCTVSGFGYIYIQLFSEDWLKELKQSFTPTDAVVSEICCVIGRYERMCEGVEMLRGWMPAWRWDSALRKESGKINVRC